jgi:hypothetical protein
MFGSGTMRIHRRWRLFARALKVAVALSVGLAFAYLIGMNTFLRTRWFRNAIGFSPEELRVEYARAYSILPGRIHVEGLSIRGSDTSVEWILTLDSCDFRVHFLDLVHRKFHADHVRGSGLSLRIRLRLEQDEATPEVVAAVPPVPGFSDPPYLEIGPPRPPLTDADYNLWTIQLDDVDAQHVRELWIQTLRYAGDMRVRGRWLFRPVRWLEVGPATVDVDTLEISYGPASPLFTALHGTVEATVHPFDVRKPDGLEVLGFVSAKTRLAGLAEPAELLTTFAPTPSWKLAPADSPIDLQLVLEHGALGPGSRVEVPSVRSALSGGDLTFRGAVAAELRVERESEQSVAHVDVGVSDLRIARHDLEVGSAASVALRLTSRDVDLTHPTIDSASFALELIGASAPSVALLRPLLPVEVAVGSGVVRGDGHLEGRVGDESASGHANLVAHGLRVQVGSDTYQGELGVALRATNLGGDPETTVLSGSTLSFTSGGAPSTDAWWARVSLLDARLRLKRGPRFRAKVHVTAENASPVQALLARVTPVPRWVLDAFPTDNLRVDGEIRQTSSSLEARSIVAESRGTSVHLEYAKHDADDEGVALISSGSLRVGVTLAGAGPKFLLFGAESWFERRVAALRARERLLDDSVSSLTQ